MSIFFSPLVITFSSWLLFCPCWFYSHGFLSASREPWSSAPSAYMLLYSLGAASCFLTGTELVLVSGFLYNSDLRWFPSLWKFSFHSEASLLSFSPCWESFENACLPSQEGWVLLFSFSDWRHMLISKAKSCMERHLSSRQNNTDKNYGIRTLNHESSSI